MFVSRCVQLSSTSATREAVSLPSPRISIQAEQMEIYATYIHGTVDLQVLSTVLGFLSQVTGRNLMLLHRRFTIRFLVDKDIVTMTMSTLSCQISLTAVRKSVWHDQCDKVLRCLKFFTYQNYLVSVRLLDQLSRFRLDSRHPPTGERHQVLAVLVVS